MTLCTPVVSDPNKEPKNPYSVQSVHIRVNVSAGRWPFDPNNRITLPFNADELVCRHPSVYGITAETLETMREYVRNIRFFGSIDPLCAHRCSSGIVQRIKSLTRILTRIDPNNPNTSTGQPQVCPSTASGRQVHSLGKEITT